MQSRESEPVLLPGMPAPFELSLESVGGETVVSFGRRAVFVFDPADRGMRNLAIVALTKAGVSGVEVAKLFGLRPEHVSRLRARAAEGGSQALVAQMGRPRLLDATGIARVYRLSDEGDSGASIAAVVGVSEATVSRLLAKRPRPEPARLDLGEAVLSTSDDAGATSGCDDGGEEDEAVEDHAAADDAGDRTDSAFDEGLDRGDEPSDDAGKARSPEAGLTRAREGTIQSAYAGAMLLHGFFDRAGASRVLASLPHGAARRYDAAALMLSASFGFALGSSSAEGTKHLLTADAGALIGLDRFPHLRTLRPRLSSLASLLDPIGLQAALARAMLAADEHAPELFFVDDHFVAYAGKAPIGKGWNTRRRHAEPGRDDTFIVDESWRVICFSSGAPSGLSLSMLGPLDQLQAIVGDRQVMIGFDRGGSYPKVFAELRRRGLHFVTYRRAPLVAPRLAPTLSWTVVDGQRHYLRLADETVELEDVGALRQITVFEKGSVALQILTSDRASSAAALARRLVHRWRIENTFKYLEDHHGIHWLCDYAMELSPDTTKVANPARAEARAVLKAAEERVGALERAIGTTASIPGEDIAATNRELRRLTGELELARDELAVAKELLKPVPAKLQANELDPEATRAVSVLHRRALQMVCRLLAYNAELDLARALNDYLEDDDEYRAITRHLLHQPGTITYAKDAIAVTLRAPDAPRVARALGCLCEQLNTSPPRLTADGRPITYQIAPRA